MAKKKKATGKRSKKSSWYPKTVGFLGLFGLVLAAYCYFSPQSSSIPTIQGRDYPKRTRGLPVKHTTYAVYDRLAGQSKSDATRLLPPDEVPDWNPMESEEKPDLTPVPQSISTSVSKTSNASASEKRLDTNAEKPQTIPTDHKATTRPTPALKPAGKAQPPAANKKNGGKNAGKHDSTKRIKATASGKLAGTSLRLQIGSIQSEVQKAEKMIQNIRKKGKIPPHMRPMIQKATIKGKTVYRVILVGHCSEKALKEYQRHLG
ncbi:MAG: hypothetical protein FJX00_00130 [Alphaproteobacteria bacterium]|nr:hypothetical protein [Alphaproteobacteria bacterium]